MIKRKKLVKSKKVAKFTKETKAEILSRDRHCVLCFNRGIIKPIIDYHHVYFGLQASRTDDRNLSSKGVGLCRDCHNSCHSCKSGIGDRQAAIDYLLKQGLG